MTKPNADLHALIEALKVSKAAYATEFVRAKGEKATDDGAHQIALIQLSRRAPPIEDPEVIRWRMAALTGFSVPRE